jgi:hypothetical protein
VAAVLVNCSDLGCRELGGLFHVDYISPNGANVNPVISV